MLTESTHLTAASYLAAPGDPAGLPGDIYTGPYGFLVAIAFFLFLGMRELRRYRQIDVETYRSEIAELKNDLAEVRDELTALRDENIANLREANLNREALIRENGALRARCAEHGISTADIEGA